MISAVKKNHTLTVGEKYLYQLIIDYDYADKETKLCKGYVYASVATLAASCGESEATIYRWLSKLITAKLIRRQRRQNTSSKLYILDLPDAMLSTSTYEAQLSLEPIANKGNKETKERLHSLELVNCFEAKQAEEVTHLIALGYKAEQAVRDYMQAGAEEIRQQIANLYHYKRKGKHFYSEAKWLNWAIRAQHRVKEIELLRQPLGYATSLAEPIKPHVEYEEITDIDGYTYFQPVEPLAKIESDTTNNQEDEKNINQRLTNLAGRGVTFGDLVPSSQIQPEQGSDVLPNETQKDTGIGTGILKLSIPHRNATPTPMSLPLHFTDHTRTTSLLHYICYECGQ